MKLFLYSFFSSLLHLSVDGQSGGGDSGQSGAGSGSAGTSAASGTSNAAAGASAGQGQGSPGVFDIRQHVDDAGNFKTDWHKAAGVSENLAKKFTRPEALARSYEQLETRINAKGIIPPGPNATQQEKDAFYNALGRPEKPEGYEFKKPEKIGDQAVPDNVWDADRATKWAKQLHEWGVPKDQAQKIMNAAVGESVEGFSNIEQARKMMVEQAQAGLEKEWGKKGTPGYDQNFGAAQRAAEHFGFDKNHPAGNDPEILKFLAKVGTAIGERAGVGTRQQASDGRMTPSDARMEANRLTGVIAAKTKENRNWHNTPEAAQLKARKSELFQMANPE